MKRLALLITAVLIATPHWIVAQSSAYAGTAFSSTAFSSTAFSGPAFSSPASSSLRGPDLELDGGGGGQAASPVGAGHGGGGGAFLSRAALGVGVSPLGIQLQADVSVTRHFNVRGTGNVFKYNTTYTSNGITATGNFNLASAGASLDFYPFRSGFRLSPGVLFYNQNQVTANANVPAGSSFTLNDETYYSANTNTVTGATPIVGTGALGLNTTKPAFTATAGFGNVARGHGHFAFPVDAGVAFIGAPTLNVKLGGWACYDAAQTQCANIADTTNPIGQSVQSNLTTQVAKWTSDLNPLKTYPILSAGVTYSFRIR